MRGGLKEGLEKEEKSALHWKGIGIETIITVRGILLLWSLWGFDTLQKDIREVLLFYPKAIERGGQVLTGEHTPDDLEINSKKGCLPADKEKKRGRLASSIKKESYRCISREVSKNINVVVQRNLEPREGVPFPEKKGGGKRLDRSRLEKRGFLRREKATVCEVTNIRTIGRPGTKPAAKGRLAWRLRETMERQN